MARCHTPGARYGFSYDNKTNELSVKIQLPTDFLRTITGHPTNLVNEYIHNTFESSVAKIYKEHWPFIAGAVIDGEVMPETYEEYLAWEDK